MAKKETQVGAWAFVIGIVIAIVLGVVPNLISTANTILVLGVLGIIVGLLNITDKELDRYLMANVAFLVASASLLAFAAVIPAVGIYLANIVGNIALFVAPGAAIVAIKEIYEVSQA